MELNDYSARFFSVLLTAFPEFSGLAVAGPEEGGFTVEFSGPLGEHFWISTEEFGRITVGRGSAHVHFGGWAESVDARDFNDAVAFIRRLLGK